MKFVKLLLLFLARGEAETAKSHYDVQACVANGVGQPCTLKKMTNMRFMKHPTAASCDEAQGQAGSVSWMDLTLPSGKALFVQVDTKVSGQSADQGFFVRPTRLTREWGKAEVANQSASFYLASTGQFSVEFAPSELWRGQSGATTFDALMLFVNPELELPTGLTEISDDSTESVIDLGPNRAYVFAADFTYDWGRDQVFKVHDNTAVYFESGAYVRARIVQTEKKVNNVTISGYGTLDSHYDPTDYDIPGVSDDRTMQTIVIFGKNINVFGVTLTNTKPECGSWGYCLNINPNWAPLPDYTDPFGAEELQLKDPPFKFRQAHCQEKNMDDSPNTDFHNCPSSHADGQHVSHVKCMTWQMGQDGLNAGKYGVVENSFVRVIDDAIKVWDSHAVYQNITIWQQTLGWPINFGWWNWDQDDIDTVVDSVYVIHNHNWLQSKDWPETDSGQCVVGGIYGSGAVKRNYRLSNIFVETAASCAVGLQITSKAYNRHPTPEGCVGSMQDFHIDGIFFDEEFYQTGGYGNYLAGEEKPNSGCTGNLSGKIENLHIAGQVAGRAMTLSEFDRAGLADTVTGLVVSGAEDPHPAPLYTHHKRKNAYIGNGADVEVDSDGVQVVSSSQCAERCQADWGCDCVVFQPSTSVCWKRRGCVSAKFDSDDGYDVYMRPYALASQTTPSLSFV